MSSRGRVRIAVMIIARYACSAAALDPGPSLFIELALNSSDGW
jgi:hypothetical protein